MARTRMYSFDRILPDGRKVGVTIPRMSHLRANITYVCDRNCHNCNRACGVAPSRTDENMLPEAYWKALASIKAAGKKLTKLILTGGEPTIHPGFDEFVDAAMDYKATFSPDCNVFVSTYFHPILFKRVEKAIERHPGLQVMGIPKKAPREHAYAPYMAPIDEPGGMPADKFYGGCHLVGALCGMTVDYKGFWCCPVAPAIARVFGFDGAIKDFADVSVDTLSSQYGSACRLCGFYSMKRADGKEQVSESWRKALTQYNAIRRSTRA